MSNGLNIHSSLNYFTWMPVDFYIENDQFSVKKDFVLFDNGTKFNLNEPFKNGADFSFNNKTGTVLTNLIHNEVLFENKREPNLKEDLILIESPLGILNNDIITILTTAYLSGNNNSRVVLYDTESNFYDADSIFYFSFIGGGLVKIYNHDKKVLTINSNLNNVFVDEALSFENEMFPPNERQTFDFLLEEDRIILFQQNTNKGVVVRKTNNNNFRLSTLNLTKNQSFTDDTILYFISYKHKELTFDSSVSNSFLVKYKTDLVQDEEYLTLDQSFTNENRYIQNYLGLFPVENPKFNPDGTASYKLYIHGLKNYQTPEYQYSTANPIVDQCPSIRRIYNKIFSGTNQRTGYEKIFLGYQSDTKVTIFPSGTETPFYFPSVSERSPLSSSGLIEDGATAGELPFTSDRISMYRMNYEEIIPGQPQPESISRHDRTWLCSWLSGTNTGDKIWMDRYYNAAYYTLDQALTAKAHVYNEKIFPNKQFTFDVPSTMYMEPGVLYKYDRVSRQNAKTFVTYLNSDRNLPKGANIVSLTNWESFPIIYDDSAYKNNAITFNSINPLDYYGTYWYMDGTSHGIIPPSKELLSKGNLTLSMWLSVDDWQRIQADQIFGNYYDGGVGLMNLGVINVPMFTIINATSSRSVNFNFNFTNLGGSPFDVNYSDPKFTVIQRLPSYDYWIIDLKNKHAILYNAFNSKEMEFSFASTTGNVDQVEFDSEYNIYMYDRSASTYVKFNSKGVLQSIETFSSTDSYYGIDITKNNEVVGVHGNNSVIDNEGNLWETIGGNLYKNKKQYAIVGETQAIVIDSSNNIWIAHEKGLISKIDTEEGTIVFTISIGKAAGYIQDPCQPKLALERFMDFLRYPFKGVCDEKPKYRDVLLVFDKTFNEILKISEDGSIIGRLDLNGLDVENLYDIEYAGSKGFTGFQFTRKFNSIGKTITSSLAWKLKIGHPSNVESTLKYITLTHTTSSLPRGWHNFSLVFDSNGGSVNYYIDSILVDSEYFTPKAYEMVYNYRSSLVLGAATIRNTTLNDIVQEDAFNKYVGNVGDIKIYSNPLTQGEIEQLYFASDFALERPELTWNRRVGNRSFVEEIEHWYKGQLPGSKSKYFNINLYNLNIDDESKLIIEDAIRENVKKILPVQNTLYKINWK